MLLPYNKGLLERTNNGYIGKLSIEGYVMEINATFWDKKKNGCDLWVQRVKEKKYNPETQQFTDYIPKPFFECYLIKMKKKDSLDYRGEFIFIGFKYGMVAWFENRTEHQLNLRIERCESQPLLNRLNEINKQQHRI